MRNEKGFTLMELMIVVAIIGILAAIALPMVSSALDKARDAREIADVRSVAGSIAVFAADGDYDGTNHAALGTDFLASDEGKKIASGVASANGTVEVQADGTVVSRHSVRSKTAKDSAGNSVTAKIPYMEFGGSLDYKEK